MINGLTNLVDELDGASGRPLPPIFICLLGKFRILKRDAPVALRSGGKIEALLSSLALRPFYRASRDTLLSALWPGSDPRLAAQCLNSLVYSVHRTFGDAIGGAPPIVHEDHTYRLNVEAGVDLDVARFEALVCEADRRAHGGDVEAAATCYGRASSLYHGDLCADTDVHALLARERLRYLYHACLARLAEFHYQQRNYSTSLTCALALLASDPCREDAHRLLMRCYAKHGERAEALHQYRLCQAILRSEFDADPEPATTALFEQIRLDPDGL